MPIRFDLAETINQIIAGLVTLASVFIGGWFAFRFGVTQLRRERAIDRRLRWQEELLDTLNDYRIMVSILAEQLAKPPGEANGSLIDHAQMEIRELSHTLVHRVGKAQLYGGPEEKELLKALFAAHVDVRLASLRAGESDESRAHSVQELRRLAKLLETSEEATSALLRKELAMPTSARTRRNESRKRIED